MRKVTSLVASDGRISRCLGIQKHRYERVRSGLGRTNYFRIPDMINIEVLADQNTSDCHSVHHNSMQLTLIFCGHCSEAKTNS
jgi:hypothetical protein